MKILVVGSGGREHALAHKISQSPMVSETIVAPGNVGMDNFARRVAVKAEDVSALLDLAKKEAVDLVVIGPEAPLVDGLADELEAVGIPAFGPGKQAAQLEGSKGYMKDILAKYHIPTAKYRRFTVKQEAIEYIHAEGAPIVVKTDGLAAGKGVTVAMSVDEAIQAVENAMDGGVFGDAGKELVIEEFMQGEELSFFALCDGEHALPLASAQDHKAVFDGDKGPNTGGMGAYSPAPVATAEIEAAIMKDIVNPTIAGMKAEGAPYKGVLFCGLMIDEKGPRVIEYNVRFGDPECQALMQRLDSDIVPALMAAAKGELAGQELAWKDQSALNVVMAAQGYPGSYEKNTVIKGLDEAAASKDVAIYHAGTNRNDAGELVATGGRVLNIIGLGSTVTEAKKRAYDAIEKIQWAEGFCRSDIGWRAIERENAQS